VITTRDEKTTTSKIGISEVKERPWKRVTVERWAKRTLTVNFDPRSKGDT
jgi:hypothetical protein